MKRFLKGRGTAIAGFALLSCLLLRTPAAEASTVVVSLNNWAQQQFNSDSDSVTVSIDNVANTLTLAWVSGNPGIPNAIGIDKFFFNGQLLTDPGYLATSTGWDLKGNGPHNAGGFPNAYLNEMDNGGGSQTSGIVFTFPADGGGTTFDTDFNASSSFAAHVRYGATLDGGTCSGFVSNQSIPGSVANDAGCLPPTQTPEASSLLMLGIGLPIVGLVIRRMPLNGKKK